MNFRSETKKRPKGCFLFFKKQGDSWGRLIFGSGSGIILKMAIKITYFVHGSTTDNEKHISSGWSDVGLSELGKRQSIELKEQTKNKTFDVIFCSDFKRALESAKLTWREAVPIITDQRLRECNYGNYNGKPSSVVEPLQENMVWDKFPNGESYEDVRVRVANFLEFLKKNLHKIYWYQLCLNPSIPIEFFEDHIREIDWISLCQNPSIPLQFFKKQPRLVSMALHLACVNSLF